MALSPTADYKQRTEALSAPETLKPGFYFLIASHKADFSENDNQITFTDVWVSELALVVRPREGNVEGFVLEANSGEPLNGAEVAAWYLDNQGSRVAVAPVRTDENGFFSVDSPQNRGLLLRVRHDGREMASQQEYWSYDRSQSSANAQTIFFTDRALYRPGQTIQYKGICLRVDTGKNNYEAIGGQRVTVIFADPNNKEIARQEHRCNDYGSFSGSFTAPRDRVMGQMRVYVSSGPNGQASFNVEEYKRPKFQVTLEAPKSAAKLNDKVSLQGKAESYTGAAIDGAQVKWRVAREVRWPYWWGWYHSWRMRSVAASQEIAHGTAASATDGTFKIEFFAKPDPKVSETNEASFSFIIYSDVTDTTGETRSAQRSINVGFTALQATLSAADWQTEDKAVEMEIGTTTLDGEPQVAEGIVKVYRLKEPAAVHRAYMGEIIRAGILSVDPGQAEASKALGYRPMQTFRLIVLPQAMKAIVPPTDNQVIGVLKFTSLASIVALQELMNSVESIYTRTFETIPMLIVAALWYLILVSVLSVGQYFIERYYSKGWTELQFPVNA